MFQTTNQMTSPFLICGVCFCTEKDRNKSLHFWTTHITNRVFHSLPGSAGTHQKTTDAWKIHRLFGTLQPPTWIGPFHAPFHGPQWFINTKAYKTRLWFWGEKDCSHGYPFQRKRFLLHFRAKLGGTPGTWKPQDSSWFCHHVSHQNRHNLWNLPRFAQKKAEKCETRVQKKTSLGWSLGFCRFPTFQHRWGMVFEHHTVTGGIPSPLKNMSSSVGMMTFPIYGERKNVPNHQPGEVATDIFPSPRHRRCRVWAPAARCFARHGAAAVPALLRVSPRRGERWKTGARWKPILQRGVKWSCRRKTGRVEGKPCFLCFFTSKSSKDIGTSNFKHKWIIPLRDFWCFSQKISSAGSNTCPWPGQGQWSMMLPVFHSSHL